ncbi:putative mitochondrial hypothetical protein [Leptomonas pyrrhocoris]|uniref:Uncharacterized protein n=1 Tax=Leptomonas pyrrhocoris TaxID=157538 RepID=A0A0M9FRV2_LEPPY|nr:putative mitochondrial hypothetical protein [Leptomonas pyrrhocoris]KPA74785.1 putative mitochondrial hypothetical protein [Leptomonas pyrrhocoris]|eukprot:XP_015653224.1 putative mitochondrial hypothetical protein [Leptomonas pyrrhocoris]
MLRHLRAFGCLSPSATFSRMGRLRFNSRCMSSRQAERLHRRSAAAATAPKKRPATPTGSHRDGSDAPPHARSYNKLTAKSAAKGSSSTKKSPSAAAATTTTAASSAGPSRPPMPGRFNRLVLERGLFFTVYLYVLGESMTLFLTYLLHTHRLGVGDVGSWLAALHTSTGHYLNVGPTVYGLQLTPRLLLNYLVANCCTYPLLPLQMRFCTATTPLLWTPLSCIGRQFRKAGAVIPKAPAAKA